MNIKTSNRQVIGAEGETRTLTAYATAPSRLRVYQFHHFGNDFYSGTSLILASIIGTSEEVASPSSWLITL